MKCPYCKIITPLEDIETFGMCEDCKEKQVFLKKEDDDLSGTDD